MINSSNASVVCWYNLVKQFGPRSGPTECLAWSGSKLFDTLMVFLKEFFENINFKKDQQTTKNQQMRIFFRFHDDHDKDAEIFRLGRSAVQQLICFHTDVLSVPEFHTDRDVPTQSQCVYEQWELFRYWMAEKTRAENIRKIFKWCWLQDR